MNKPIVTARRQDKEPIETKPPETPAREEWVVVISDGDGLIGFLDQSHDYTNDVRLAVRFRSRPSIDLFLSGLKKFWHQCLAVPTITITPPAPQGEVIWEGFVARHKNHPGDCYADADGIPNLYQEYGQGEFSDPDGESMLDQIIYNKPAPVRLVKAGGE